MGQSAGALGGFGGVWALAMDSSETAKAENPVLTIILNY
jgi:hypothetical protein